MNPTIYIDTIQSDRADFVDSLSKKYFFGKSDLFEYKIRLMLLNNYIKIIVDFFDCNDYTVNNHLTEDQIDYLVYRINLLIGKSYKLDL